MSKGERETPRQKVMKLIEWYEKNKPDAGRRIEVMLTPKKLAKEFGLTPPAKGQREFGYRGRTLVAVATEVERQ